MFKANLLEMNGQAVTGIITQNGVVTGGGYQAQGQLVIDPMSVITRLCESMMIMSETSHFNDVKWDFTPNGGKFNTKALFNNCIYKNIWTFASIYKEYEKGGLKFHEIPHKSGPYKDLGVDLSKYQSMTINRTDTDRFPKISKDTAEVSVIAEFDYIILQTLAKISRMTTKFAAGDIMQKIGDESMFTSFTEFVNRALSELQRTHNQAYQAALEKFQMRVRNALDGTTSRNLMIIDYNDAVNQINKKKKRYHSLQGLNNSKVMWAYLFSKITRRLLEQVGVYDPTYSNETQGNLRELQEAMRSILQNEPQNQVQYIDTLIKFKHFFIDNPNSSFAFDITHRKKLKDIAKTYFLMTFAMNAKPFMPYEVGSKRYEKSIDENMVHIAAQELLKDKLPLLPSKTSTIAVVQYNPEQFEMQIIQKSSSSGLPYNHIQGSILPAPTAAGQVVAQDTLAQRSILPAPPPAVQVVSRDTLEQRSLLPSPPAAEQLVVQDTPKRPLPVSDYDFSLLEDLSDLDDLSDSASAGEPNSLINAIEGNKESAIEDLEGQRSKKRRTFAPEQQSFIEGNSGSEILNFSLPPPPNKENNNDFFDFLTPDSRGVGDQELDNDKSLGLDDLFSDSDNEDINLSSNNIGFGSI